MSIFVFILSIWITTQSLAEEDYLHGVPDAGPQLKMYLYIPTTACRKKENFRRFDYWTLKDHDDYSWVAASLDKVIYYNRNMTDEGDEINVFLSPGIWPKITYSNTGKYTAGDNIKGYYCGGIPQKCSFTEHVRALKKLFRSKPRFNKKSLGIIAGGHWRPLWRQNTRWDKLIYQIHSVNHEWNMTKTVSDSDTVKARAIAAFERESFKWYNATIREAQAAKNRVIWGYMGLPTCYTDRTEDGSCSAFSREDNERMIPLLRTASRALYPTGFLDDPKKYRKYHSNSTVYLRNLVRESFRISRLFNHRKYVIMMVRYKYKDGSAMSLADLIKSIVVPCNEGVDGIVIYGAPQDASTKRCDDIWPLYRNLIEVALTSPEVTSCRLRWHAWYHRI